MSNHIGIRKNLYFSAKEKELLELVKFLCEASGYQFSTVVKQLIRHGVKPYSEANGIQRPLPQLEVSQ